MILTPRSGGSRFASAGDRRQPETRVDPLQYLSRRIVGFSISASDEDRCPVNGAPWLLVQFLPQGCDRTGDLIWPLPGFACTDPEVSLRGLVADHAVEGTSGRGEAGLRRRTASDVHGRKDPAYGSGKIQRPTAPIRFFVHRWISRWRIHQLEDGSRNREEKDPQEHQKPLMVGHQRPPREPSGPAKSAMSAFMVSLLFRLKGASSRDGDPVATL